MKSYIVFDMIINFITRGCGYTDYFRGNYINLTSSEKDTFVTAKSFYKFLSYMNDKKYQVILNDKIVKNKPKLKGSPDGKGMNIGIYKDIWSLLNHVSPFALKAKGVFL